jgi:protein-S-isoprenylcysteine O-methyltransferase Ste14
MSVEAAHHSYWETSDVVFGIPLLLGIALQWAFPLALSEGTLRLALILVGAAFIALGVGLIVLARREFAQHGQPTDPGLPTGQVVTTGVFSVSRNPLYLGVVVLLVGLALALNILWILVFLAPAIVICHYVLIVPEEKYLAVKFGAEYAAYAASVHRWLGRG